MSRAEFDARIEEITAAIAGSPLDPALRAALEASFGPESAAFASLLEACRSGEAEGWICPQEHGGIRYGRVVQASERTHGFSVDVVWMRDVRGPYHRHPKGEIDLVMPLEPEARFDGHGAGWWVYGPESAHYPTSSGGAAYVLYLLPEGAIDFKAKPPAQG
ncbi:MAG: DUF4863 family protein [Myxococcales bacterium]|nr:DUF4863 family protein [Myxococcales bacterium]